MIFADAPQFGLFFTFRGRGYVIGLIAGGCLLVSDWLCGVRYHDPEFYAQHGWPKLAAFMAAALIVWWLNSLGHEETIGVGQQEMKQKPFFREPDSLMMVPARYWPFALCALGVVFYFVRD
jgi:hypothetical protein